jgi:uncharacterized protein YehS (DUF1456 family)
MVDILPPNPTTATREEVTANIVAWRAIREERLAADKVADALKKQENELKQFIISALLAQKYEGIVSAQRVTGVSTKEQPVVKDRTAFEKFVLKKKALHLFQFRISAPAICEMQDAGVVIPGVESEKLYDLFDRKA